MSEIVSQRSSLHDRRINPTNRFNEVSRLVLPQKCGKGSPHLCHFEGVGKPVMKDLAPTGRDYLGDFGKAAEGR